MGHILDDLLLVVVDDGNFQAKLGQVLDIC